MTTEDNKGRSKLRGQINFIEWMKRFEAFAKIKSWGSFSRGKFTEVENKSSEAFEWIICNVSDEAIQAIDVQKSLSDNLELLNKAYGYGRLKPITQQQNILDNIDFPVSKDPSQVFL